MCQEIQVLFFLPWLVLVGLKGIGLEGHVVRVCACVCGVRDAFSGEA